MEDRQGQEPLQDSRNEGRDQYFMDIDRMVNEGLGGGTVTMHNGLIEETSTDSMHEAESVEPHRSGTGGETVT